MRARVLARLVGDEDDRPPQVGRFTLLERIAAGGMGVVFAAYDPELDRKIAVKLLRSDRADELLRRRIVREAQAMAKLNHPNVAQVYEVGEHHGSTFIAMEFVRGQTLRQWQPNRPWNQVLGVYVQAARGLAAAHAAGLVHRDFKPDNAIVGRDDRVRVLDFGLARLGEVETTLEDPHATILPSPNDDAMATPLTHEGSLMGTPAYMAPEQFLGEDVTAKSDQFSFCVALWEGLFGERPFAGTTRAELVASVTVGRMRPMPRDNRVPRAVREALTRGLETAPDRRFATINALLEALDPEPARRRRRWLVGSAAATTLAAGAVAPWFVVAAPAPCAETDQALRGVWDDERREALRAAMVASDRAFAIEAAARIDTLLGGYADEWIAQRRDACEATWVRREQSEALMDARMACLDDRAGALAAAIDTLSGGDAQAFAQADRLVAGLPVVARCGERDYVDARTPPPEDPESRARVLAVQAALQRTRALSVAGRMDDARAEAEALAEAIEGLAYPPVVAEARLALGTFHDTAGDFVAGEREHLAAYFTAYRAGQDDLAMRASLALLRNVGDRQRRFDDAARWEQHAEAGIGRLAEIGTERERVEFLRTVATVRTREGRLDDAVARAREAIELAAQVHGVGSLPRAHALDTLASALDLQGRHDDALQAYQQSHDITVSVLGNDHPLVAIVDNNIAASLSALGRDDEADAHGERALQIRERAFGPDHYEVAQSLANRGTQLYRRGELARAEELLRRAVRIQERRLGPDAPDLALTLASIAEILAVTNRLDEAERVYARAYDIQKRLAPDHPHRIGPMLGLANVLFGQGRHAEAQALATESVAAFEARFGADHPTVAYPWIALTRIEAALGHEAAAIAAGERALALRGDASVRPLERAEARQVLADVLWEARDGRSRARALVVEARAMIEGDATAAGVLARAELDRWLAEHIESR